MGELTRIVSLAELMRRQQNDVATAELQLKAAKEALARTERTDLPELMAEFGLSELRLDDGAIISIKEEVDAKIAEEKMPEAINWLTANNFGGIIKTKVAVAFAAEDHDKAVGLSRRLIGEGLVGTEMSETIHPSTLKSFVKERLAAGDAIPFDVFGIYPYSKAILKEKK